MLYNNLTFLSLCNKEIYGLSTTKPETGKITKDPRKHILTLIVIDAAGNSTEKDVDITYDVEAPTVTNTTILNGTVGVNGGIYVVGDVLTVSMTWMEPELYSIEFDYQETVTTGNLNASSSSKTTIFDLDISSLSVDFENEKTANIVITDYACNETTVPIRFYKIDTSRDIVIKTFNVHPEGAVDTDPNGDEYPRYNIIGPRSVASGIVAPIYQLADYTFLDESRGQFGVGGNSGNNIFDNTYVASGEQRNAKNIATWYSQHPEGTSLAYLTLYNIYGRSSVRTVGIYFDYTAPELTIEIDEENKTAIVYYIDNKNIADYEQKIGSNFSYYMTANGKNDPKDYVWLHANGNESNTNVEINLSSGESELFIYTREEGKDYAGNIQNRDKIYYFHIKIDFPEEGKTDESTSIDEEIINVKGTTIDPMVNMFAMDRIIDMFRTTVNVASDAVVAAIIANNENELDYSLFSNTEEYKDII